MVWLAWILDAQGRLGCHTFHSVCLSVCLAFMVIVGIGHDIVVCFEGAVGSELSLFQVLRSSVTAMTWRSGVKTIEDL